MHFCCTGVWARESYKTFVMLFELTRIFNLYIIEYVSMQYSCIHISVTRRIVIFHAQWSRSFIYLWDQFLTQVYVSIDKILISLRNPFLWVVTVTKIFMNKLRELSRNLWTFWKLLGLIITKNIEIVPKFQRCPETMVFHHLVVNLQMIGILFHPCVKEWIVIGRPFLQIVQPKVVHGLVASFR